MSTTILIREKLEQKFSKGWIPSVDCGPGWDWILEDLHNKLTYLDFNYELHQVKEKFGTLRFYYQSFMTKSVVLDLMDDAVTVAEMLSASTCEICGNSSRISRSDKSVKYDSSVGLKVRGGWYKTLCFSCAEESGFEKDEL